MAGGAIGSAAFFDRGAGDSVSFSDETESAGGNMIGAWVSSTFLGSAKLAGLVVDSGGGVVAILGTESSFSASSIKPSS